LEADGHDVGEIWEAIYRAKFLEMNGKPICIIAHTVKGKGVEECEFNYAWHTHPPTAEKADLFLREMAERYQKPYEPFGWKKGMTVEADIKDLIEGEQK